MDDAVAKDRELNQLCEWIKMEDKALEHDYVTHKELDCVVDIITENINDLKQEIQQLRQDIEDFMQEIREFNQKRDVEVVKKEDGGNKIKIEYFSDLRKSFTKFKR